MKLTPDQSTAVEYLREWVADRTRAPVLTVTGPAGTGKTTLLRIFAGVFAEQITFHPKTLEPESLPVFWCATTGKAARRLQEATNLETKTLHSVLYFPPDQTAEAHNSGPRFESLQKAPSNAVVVVDEASMITPQVAKDLDKWIEEGTRFVLVGDPWQLPPVITSKDEKTYGADYTVFSEDSGLQADSVGLTTVVRTKSDLLDVATFLREEKRLPAGIHYDTFKWIKGRPMVALDAWLDEPEGHVLITWRNELRMEANRYLRTKLGKAGVLPGRGEPIMFCKNGQGVLNGEIATIAAIGEGPKFGELSTFEIRTEQHHRPIIVSMKGRKWPMDGGLPWIDKWGEYRGALRKYVKRIYGAGVPDSVAEPIPITWGYVLTAHKAQGSEWDHASVFLSGWDPRSRAFLKHTQLPDGDTIPFGVRWLYTALTRAKKSATLVIG